MPEELEIARTRRLRDFSVERLKELLKYHQTRVRELQNLDPEQVLVGHKTMIDAIQEVLEERKEEK